MDYDRIKSWPFDEIRQTYDERDAMLYALSVGFGSDPLDGGQLRYAFEEPALDVVPSMASILGHPGFWMRDGDTGIDWVRVVHAEQGVTLHEPLPAAATIAARNRVKAIVDKGPEKGAIVYTERTIADVATRRALATVEGAIFCRGDGGLARSDQAPAAVPNAADNDPDAVWDHATLPQQALLYRLSGDRNPLHASVAVAAQAGFDRPILHGLATFGIATHAVLRMFCDYEASALASFRARFSAPVFPGETIRTELWKRGDDVTFRATVPERGVVVLTHGHATLVSPAADIRRRSPGCRPRRTAPSDLDAGR
jgi:acyl dehydratase